MAASGSRFWIVASSAILLVVLGAFAWFYLAVARGRGSAGPAPIDPKAKSYREATHLDVRSARLVAAEGKTVLEWVVLDVAEGEVLSFTRRDGAPDANHAWVFMDRNVDRRAARDAGTRPGALEAAVEETGAAGARRARIDLPGAVDRVTVVDQRWEKGQWQGFEIALPGAQAPPAPPAPSAPSTPSAPR